jgi:natural product biosynthesis luciferase-like monooxygenase protein
MSAERQRLLETAARLLRSGTRPGVLRPAEFAAVPAPAAVPSPPLAFSLMFFSALGSETPQPGLYDLIHDAAAIADQGGFRAIWMPERHFHVFGGPYPDPAVLAASLARNTGRLRLRAGSVVLPLHHPASIAEAWSVVDNLSGGRVDIAFGSGWNPNDFVLAPDAFARRREIMMAGVETVRRLWRGEALDLPDGKGATISTRILPRPLQPELPVWLSSTGSADTFRSAGACGGNILTMLIGGDLDDLAGKITLYREARREAGLDPAGGTITLMLHTLMHRDEDLVRRVVRAPFLDYVRSSLDLQRHGSEAGTALTEEQRERMVGFAYERYTRSAALFGTPDSCGPLIARVAAAGVNEIACLVDFGVESRLVLEGIEQLATLAAAEPKAASPARPIALRTAAGPEPIAIVGMAARLPGSPDIASFWRNLVAGRDLVGPPPPGRGEALPRGGFLDDVLGFDAGRFGIAPAEAAGIDPHHRLLLEMVWAALEDAGLGPASLRGSDTGIFAALYSTGFAEHAARAEGPVDGVAIVGQLHSMAPNRISFAFDWSGPSEVVNTACSSGLVAIHRAVSALRDGDCALAVVGGASLLLSDAESAALARLGLLSPGGTCRAFDRDADGQVRGEGVAALVLKPLAAAERDGDFVYATIRGSAVNHSGARSHSLTLPNPRRQAECVRAALARSGVSPESIGLVEAHGAGTAAGDLAELSALGQVASGRWLVGSVKSNIGSLDACGGLAATIKAALALHHRAIPATLNRANWPEGIDPAGPLAFADRGGDWPEPAAGPRRALVHAYGLGGTNADLVLEESLGPRAPRRPVATTPFERRIFPLPGSVPVEANPVGSFYDFVTRPEAVGDADIYLTLAPFPAPVPGFSWTRSFQDPRAHPEHWDLIQQAQREMREVLFQPVDFTRVRRMLDIGCGLATDLMVLAERHPGLQGVGYTLSAAQAAADRGRIAARGLADRVEVFRRDSARDPFPGRFDLAIGFEVAHHIEDKDALFANLAEHLAADGLLLLADTVANTVAPIDLPQIGSWTLDQDSYAALFARHGFKIRDCIDVSAEIANFLTDPGLDEMLDRESRRAGDGRALDLAVAVHRSWDGFGHALRSGLVSYILLVAEPGPGDSGLLRHNRRMLEPS